MNVKTTLEHIISLLNEKCSVANRMIKLQLRYYDRFYACAALPQSCFVVYNLRVLHNT
jgi:hypothetical protein